MEDKTVCIHGDDEVKDFLSGIGIPFEEGFEGICISESSAKMLRRSLDNVFNELKGMNKDIRDMSIMYRFVKEL